MDIAKAEIRQLKQAWLAFAILFFVLTKVTAQTSCGCASGERQINLESRIVVCGTPESDNKGAVILSSIRIRDCLTGQVLFDNTADAIQLHSVKKYPDSIVITELVLLPDSSMRAMLRTPVPLSSRVLKVLRRKGKETIYFGEERFVFRAPSLNDTQKKYLDKLCKKLDASIKKPAVFYPGDETSIYALFLGAVNNYHNCQDLFKNLQSYFVLDAAIAETRSEIPFEYIFNNMKGH